MTSSIRLGGFKVLKNVVGFSLAFSDDSGNTPAMFFNKLTQKNINMPYLTFTLFKGIWGMDIIVDTVHGLRVSLLIEENLGKTFTPSLESSILSVFPHKNNPEVTGKLLKVLGSNNIKLHSLGNSPSTISVVLNEADLCTVSEALFKPFSFSAYRTSEDWKLAQKDKEDIYKEVVASYQEKRPKVYALECYEGKELFLVSINRNNLSPIGEMFINFAGSGLDLTFSATGRYERTNLLAFSLPLSGKHLNTGVIDRLAPGALIDRIPSVAVFSMNGPHFGDRYGIASELLSVFEKNRIGILSLSCTIASVSGVVPSLQLDATIDTIKDCFEVPAVIRK